MDTGQLFIQASAKPMADYSKPAASATSYAQDAKKESGSFDGMLREATPKHYSKQEKPTRTESKPAAQNKASQPDEPANTQQPEVARVKNYDDTEKTVSKKGTDESQVVKNKAEESLPETRPAVLLPQNVDLATSGAQVSIVPQLPESNVSKSVIDEGDFVKNEVKVVAQNATQLMQLPEGRIQQPLMTKNGLDKLEVQTDAQKATSALMTPAVEVAVEQLTGNKLLNDLNTQLHEVDILTNADTKVLTSHLQEKTQPVKTDESSDQGLKKAELVMEKMPIMSVKAAEQKTTEDGQAATGVAQPAIKMDAIKQKPVLKQEPVNTTPIDLSAQGDKKILDDASVQQKPEKSQGVAVSSEFRFSRSASIELSIGTAGNTIDQPKVKLAVSAAGNTEAAVKISDGALSGSSGSESGSMGKDTAEGFGRQNLELPKPSMLQMTNGQIAGATNLSLNNATQVVPQEQIIAASSDNVAGQVKTQLSTHNIKQGNEQITIQLSPDHLGDIKVSFKLEDQRLKVEIVAENRSARESLMQHADSLKESLARQNIHMDKFEVTGGGSNNANHSNNPQSEWREMAKNRQSQQWLASGGYRTPMTELSPALPVYFAKTEKSTLDLHF